ncbi:ABC-2 type transport system ATP-binding protein [Actinoalloteichus hoggarensis]|uniref:Daunorubicin/doxorubicin resistance ATP-binding protein DrrA n=1 Tax=Actinoalloteichus hoggarensis TaxID=1470176 RepID=A0A221W494_9PSEU|nr:ATP-binding cassette domain-containing protein [Actinoalloteichus hoggarensis]ASO20523.1 Daunorubicin/doxorubicin resistance ATP-binding protein DrrA [Actinoalloteichus hoggarensis]MBB5923563.1 ABC-2 type transport system ATP-binding protein [Actinoalloteichus hoggarensis]
MSSHPPALDVHQLHRRYRDVDVLTGLDLTVPAGRVCALLGPNGAGKTTTVRILATLLRAHGGRAAVDGVDVAADPAGVRRRIGLVGQHTAVDDALTARQNLRLFGGLHHLDAPAARRRADDLLDRFGLAHVADRRVARYSGGMRRRLDLAVGLIQTPAVLFLDEPTTGLDPRSREELWQEVRGLAAEGTTILLTTQYLDEADRLADQITVLDHGRAVAAGTPEELKASLGVDRLDVVVGHPTDLSRAAEILGRVTDSPVTVDADSRRATARTPATAAATIAVLRALDAENLTVHDVARRRATLDEVFLSLTGRPARPHDTDADTVRRVGEDTAA